jgi:hypothetical protein
MKISIRVQGSGFRVQGLGFEVQPARISIKFHGSLFRAQPMRISIRVQGSGFRVQGSGFRVPGLGFRVRGSAFANLDQRSNGSGVTSRVASQHGVNFLIGHAMCECWQPNLVQKDIS